MKIYRVDFRPKPGISREWFQHLALSYLGALYTNGQAYGDYRHGWSGDVLRVIITIPFASSVYPRSNDPYVTRGFNELRSQLQQKPDWQFLAEDDDRVTSSLEPAPFLYLFTTGLTDEPPIHRGHDGVSVPTYLLPLHLTIRERVFWWSSEYGHFDRVWLNSGPLEMPAYRQLASIDSENAKQGRELCGIIEAAVLKPTFYYLMRYKGRKRNEAELPCPGCGKGWAAHAAQEGQPFYEFHFKCDKCRLVSHLASE